LISKHNNSKNTIKNATSKTATNKTSKKPQRSFMNTRYCETHRFERLASSATLGLNNESSIASYRMNKLRGPKEERHTGVTTAFSAMCSRKVRIKSYR
jgi:hypothetical protein